MLLKAKTLESYKLYALDGEIGHAKDFYFDDHLWTIRYLVANTGNWLTGRQVLISPNSLVDALTEERRILIDLTKSQIEASPSLDSDKPVSRQFEQAYYGYYGMPMYWGGAYPTLVPDPFNPPRIGEPHKAWDANLRSTQSVTGHHIEAADGAIGHVDDFVIDSETWTIRYMVVATHNWWPGKNILVSPQWIERVSWSESKVFVRLSREAIIGSPDYSAEIPITPDYEARLLRHYDLPVGSIDELVAR